eukprot:7885496-Alexandrium_andersonii.AAC.1
METTLRRGEGTSAGAIGPADWTIRNVYIPPEDKRSVALALATLPAPATPGHLVGDLNIDLTHPRDATEVALELVIRAAYSRWGLERLEAGPSFHEAVRSSDIEEVAISSRWLALWKP